VIEAYVGLGSNLGDRLGNLGAAVDRLALEPGFTVRAVSLAYESEPIGPPQPHYLNAVARIGTLLAPRAMLARLRAIEDAMGRVRRERWGSREIDLDLLLYGDRVVQETGLQVPHPMLAQRAFVLAPLCELDPDARHPGLGLTAAELLQRLPPEVRAQARPWRAIRRSLDEPRDDEPPPAKEG
jgi:2-amino-4-hydroxy-6-hydroxymethyldihydropteridine diphosphokinase